AAYDTDGTAYTNFITFTAGTTPTMTFPQSGGGTDNYLRADGAWAPPPAGAAFWSRAGTTLTPNNSGDNVEIDGGRITVNTIDEYGAGVGVAIDSLLIKDGNIGASDAHQGIAYLSEYKTLGEGVTLYNDSYIYSSTTGHTTTERRIRYGGTKASPVATPSNSVLGYLRLYVHDGTGLIEVMRETTSVVGAVATDNITASMIWSV
ncbi:unnamed protein product, partial [marine sediment metagenome]